MVRRFTPGLAAVLPLLSAAALVVQAKQVPAQGQERLEPGPTAVARPLDFAGQQEKVNAWTVGLAAGLIEGAPLRLASEMARVVDDGPNLHVLPIVTRGPTESVNSLVQRPRIDTLSRRAGMA
jgi:hypothetical protein